MTTLTYSPEAVQTYWKPYFEKKGVDLNSVRVYEAEEAIPFNISKHDNTKVLSNLYNCNVYYAGQRWHGSEQLFFYFLTEEYPEIREGILKCKSAAEVKQFMRGKPLDHDADNKRFQAMRIALRAKAESNIPFKTILLNSGDKALVEDSSNWYDTTYGTVLKDGYYVGVNATGRLLMELRTQLQQEMRSKTVSVI